ncbi:unnamed protein product [Enterobius vermicularis]|uniref:Pepsin-I3 domain-containing protein n=1 Tax=Enterobius vermicularis TaxID=51028 RepID=A0A0N4VMB5_ENTVE|nr:unnamed protein product [Enterobius vermicularis]
MVITTLTCCFNNYSETELSHLFGVQDNTHDYLMINYEFLLTKKKKQIGEQKIWQKVSVDNYWIDKPSKVIDRNVLVSDHLVLVITVLVLLEVTVAPMFGTSTDTTVLASFHSVVRNGDTLEDADFEANSIYVGESISHNNTRIALVEYGSNSVRFRSLISDGLVILPEKMQKSGTCASTTHRENNSFNDCRQIIDRSKLKSGVTTTRGLVIKDDGYYLIQPMLGRGSKEHVIQKRSLDTKNHSCAARDDPISDNDLFSHFFRSFGQNLYMVGIQELTIELGVFVDDALWFYFNELYGQKAEKELQRYVLAIVNNIGALFGHSSMNPKLNIKITRYELMKKSPPQLNRQLHLNGEVDRLLDVFCSYQGTLNPSDDKNPRHWDHALLLSGVN